MNAQTGIVGGGQHLIDVRKIDVLGRPQGGRGCTCCDLPDKQRHEMHLMLLSGASYRKVSGQFFLTKSSVHRHLVLHLWPEIVRMVGEDAMLVGGNLMDADTVVVDLGRVRNKMVDLVTGQTVDDKVRVSAAGKVHGISRTALELSGHIKGNAAVQVNVGGGGGSDDLEAVYAILRDKGHHDLIETIGARLAGIELIEGSVVEQKE